MRSNLDSNNYSESELSLLHEQADNNISQETSIMPPKLPTTRRGRRLRKEQREALAQGRYLGLGFAAYIEPTGAATGHLATEGATIRMEPTGKINVYADDWRVAGGAI